MALFQITSAALTITQSLSSSLIDALLFVAPLVTPLAAPLARWSYPTRLRGHSIYVYHNGKMDPLNVSSRRELEDIFQQYVALFEGNETEQNWIPREKAVKKLQRITWGDAPHRFPKAYVAGIKLLLDGILKTVNSLRTTLSANGCKLVQEIAISAGSGWTGGLDPSMVDILLQNLIKLCCNTKNLAAEDGNTTVNVILANVTYNARLLHHIWNACEHKNEKPRTYASGWLKTIFTKHGHHKNILEHAGGIELIEKCIKKGLGDANPGAREGMRGTFWAFAQLWPEKSKIMMSGLDAKQQGFLAKHPGNPHPTTDTQTNDTKPVRSSLKDTIAAHKKAKAVGKPLPLRPRSAQPTPVEVNTTPNDLSVEEPVKPLLENAKSKVITPALDAKQQAPLAERPDKPNPLTDNTITDIKPVPSSHKETTAAKAAGEDLSRRPRSAHQATVEDDTTNDEVLVERPVQSSHEVAKTAPTPPQKRDTIFGSKRAKEAELNPQPEQLPKDVKRLLAGPRRRPRKPVVKSAEDICFIKPRKNKAKPEAEQTAAKVRPRPVLESPKPVRVDSSHWGWRKCILAGHVHRGLTGLLCERMELEDDSLNTIMLEDSLEIATDMCKTPEAIWAILDFLEAESWKTKPELKNVSGMKSMALYTLSYLARRQVREAKGARQPFSDKQALPLAMLAQKSIKDENVEVRAATMEYCVDLYAATTTLQFWKISEGDDTLEALIWYHLTKKDSRR